MLGGMTGPLSGKRALVTGASSGIGTAFAHELASRGASIVITARRQDRLEEIAKSLREKHGVEVDVIALDLGKPEAPLALYEATEGRGKTIDLLINNAGFGTKRPHVENPWEKIREEMQLNLVSLTELTRRFTERMVERKTGYVLNVASVGAYLPTPTMATYGAGKSYVRNFSEALAYELSGSGVRVCCLCPGATESEFSDVAGLKIASWKKVAYMSAERCARIGVNAVLRGRRNIVSGFWNSVSMFMLRFVPRRVSAFLADTFL
jgi:short-subunit dehydrogenase